TKDRAIIRPLDRVDGYFVRDERRAQRLTGAMGFYGPFLPGPDPNTLWIPDEKNPGISMRLVTADGRSAHQAIHFPRQIGGFAAPDGNGYALASTARGIFDLRPHSVHRITTDALIAAGPTGWLTAACHRGPECGLTLIDSVTGKRHGVGTFPGTTAGGMISPANPVTGIISADGSHAALITTEGLHVLSLRTGIDTLISVPLDSQAIQPGTIVWSPDSRWLFVAGADGRVYAVDARSSSVHYLNQIPPVTQLAIRTTAGA
ncbi:MAG TPA: hypothetical protein VHC49_18055, partial [Mycobacteriales bacterium]|nr:hypothetical protein [Mycobacteriales bacterium]